MTATPDMDMPESDLAIGELKEIIADHCDLPADAVHLERCATGKFNTTYYVSGPADPLVIRIAPPDNPDIMLFYEYRMMRQEPAVHAAIQANTTVPVPTIHAYDTSHQRINHDYLIMQRMPGTPISDHAGMTRHAFAACLRDVGDALRQVHAIHGHQYGYVGPHAPMTPQSDWTSAFVIMWNKLIDDTERCRGYSPDEATYMRRLLDTHIKAFDRNEPPSLLHMDVWAQNVLADDAGQLTCLLDWDRAAWGDPEIEFAILDYCGISEPPFWEGYGQTRDRSPQAEIRRLFYLLYEIQKYILIRAVRNNQPKRAAQYRKQSLQLAQQLA